MMSAVGVKQEFISKRGGTRWLCDLAARHGVPLPPGMSASAAHASGEPAAGMEALANEFLAAMKERLGIEESEYAPPHIVSAAPAPKVDPARVEWLAGLFQRAMQERLAR